MEKEDLSKFISNLKKSNIDISTISVEQIPFSGRVKNCLRTNSIISMSQLIALNSSDIRKWRNMGKRSIDEVECFQFEFSQNIDVPGSAVTQSITDDAIKLEKDYTQRDFINFVFPATMCVEKAKVFYKVRDSFLVEDVKKEAMNLPARINSLMINCGMKYANDLLNTPYQKLQEIPGLGARSMDKAAAWYRDNTILLLGSKPIDDFYLGMTAINKICKAAEDSFLMAAYRFNIVNLILDDKLVFNRNKTIKAHTLKSLQNKKNIQECFVQDIFKFLNGRDWTSFTEIKAELSYYGFDESKIVDALESLVSAKKIDRLYRKYRIRYCSVKSWARKLPDKKQRDIILSRLKGATLEELGVKYGVTKEYIRQITKKVFLKAPCFSEDYDSYWYVNYNFSMDIMITIIGVSEEAYRYYSMVYERGKKSIDLIVDDPYRTTKIIKSYYKYLYRDSVCIEGEWIARNRPDILRKAAELIASNTAVPKESIYKQYYQILSKYKLGSDFEYANDNSLYNALDRTLYILKGCEGLRYYPMMNYELNDLVNSLHLDRFKNVVISSLKLFNDNPGLMAEFEIRDHYELHNLLKKYDEFIECIQIRYNLRFGRMPNLYFGDCDIDRQLFNLLKKNSPIEGMEFACLAEDEYGLNHNSIIFNHIDCFKKYLHNGLYSVSIKPLSSEELKFFKENLCGDFYFFEDIESKYIQKFSQDDFNRLNSYVWKQLGYIPYAHFLVSNRYASAADYFKYILTKDNLIDIDALDSRIVDLHQFSVVLHELTRNIELIEYDVHRYIRLDRFLDISGLSDKKIILDFIKQFKIASKNETFFTDFYMRKKGFNHAIYKSESKNEFIYALLIKNSRTIPYIRLGHKYLFANTKEDFSMVSFIRWLIKDSRQVRMYSLISDIEMNYGITLKKDNIIMRIKDSSMYYDSDMEKLYLTKNDFYNDL